MDPQTSVNNTIPTTPASVPKATRSSKSILLHASIVVSLYTCAWEVINILFSVINHAFPQSVQSYSYFFGSSSISWPVSVTIVVFPVFILLSWIAEKMYISDTEGHFVKNKRDVIYVNLFVAGLILVGCLVTTLYYFIDGQDITSAFLLKVLSLVVLAGLAFGYYIMDLRNQLTPSRRREWVIVATLVVIFSIATGFMVIGSPRTQRNQRVDAQRIADLQNIQSQVISYWQNKGVLPGAISDLNDSLTYYSLPKDPDTNVDYEYQRAGAFDFMLCAVFSVDQPSNTSYYYQSGGDNWTYQRGRTCFKRSIDPQLYPVYSQPSAQPIKVKPY